MKVKEKITGDKKRKEKKDQKSIFYKMSLSLYKRVCIHKLPMFSSGQVERDLLQLYPGENIQCLKTEYYVKKISLVIVILAAGLVLGAAAKFSARDRVLLENGKIPRSDYTQGRTELQVQAKSEKGTRQFHMQLYPRQLTYEETDALADSLLEDLPDLILNGNENLGNVRNDLLLEEEYENYPFQVEWESSRPESISSAGAVTETLREPKEAELLIRLSYGDYLREESIPITLQPPDLAEEEAFYRELEEYLLSEEESTRKEAEWSLPDQWQGETIQWSQQVEDNSAFLWAAAAVTAVLVYLMSDRDLHGRLEKRKECLRTEYPDMVRQLALFIGAGMTVRGAFRRIASDYEQKRDKTGKKRPAYEEMLHACRELQTGVSEGAAYEHFGRRTGLQEYIRLSTLLMQNLKRGSSTLLERLREEADKAGDEKLLQNRRLGEEAGTKLLVPMVMMLAVVMVIIMIPAFSAI